MTSHWVICFSLAVATGCPPSYSATVRGTIAVTDGKHTKGKHADLSGTVVWLQSQSGELSEPVRLPRLEMAQKNKSFQPHVLAVPVGARVDFPNFDPIFHNAFSNYNGEIFDIGLYPPGASREVRFAREGVVRVFCNIHSSMSAVIVVLRTSYYDVSKADGTFEIDGVRDGDYILKLYQERATEQTLAALSRRVEVGKSDAGGSVSNLGIITIAEDGYAVVPHLNKYGKPYGTPMEPNTYPGARQ